MAVLWMKTPEQGCVCLRCFDDPDVEEDEPDDHMTLDQYQEEARRVALVRKGPLLDVESQKKGRLELSGSNLKTIGWILLVAINLFAMPFYLLLMDLNQTETNISNLESLDDNLVSQSHLSSQYARLAAIQRQMSIKWAQRARLLWVSDEINIGPRSLCVFCKIEYESIDHIFLDCRWTQIVWNMLNQHHCTHISFPDPISAGCWLTEYNYSIYTMSVIAACIWLIWKARCDAIFSNVTPSFNLIASKAAAHVLEFSQENSSHIGRKLLLNNFSHINGLILFFAFSCCTFSAESCLEASIKALQLAIRSSLDRQFDIKRILHCCPALSSSLLLGRNPAGWRVDHDISVLNHFLHLAGNPPLVFIPPSPECSSNRSCFSWQQQSSSLSFSSLAETCPVGS
ncbi:uncharacterized protein LOC120275327 [Dioscorea cayenensis subsp. rotundata]|uniref:Uncharacterized protein LOC120275327 n=1 Tax=Dioscorea cayennensis subsp. rotundata TaxID=55577 RepID=A0AB40CD90_DIOCR|nr:uncharacterized protein LOC120275327 [Dioscorea cayenensis subsp. rotundata]